MSGGPDGVEKNDCVAVFHSPHENALVLSPTIL